MGLASWASLTGPEALLAGPQAWLAAPQAWLAGPQTWLDGPEGGTNGRTNERTDKHTENLPIQQDFVPYRGCSPKKKNFAGFEGPQKAGPQPSQKSLEPTSKYLGIKRRILSSALESVTMV